MDSGLSPAAVLTSWSQPPSPGPASKAPPSFGVMAGAPPVGQSQRAPFP